MVVGGIGLQEEVGMELWGRSLGMDGICQTFSKIGLDGLIVGRRGWDWPVCLICRSGLDWFKCQQEWVGLV